MPRLRFFVCDGCGVVYADVEPPADCGRCEEPRFEELEPGGGAAAYFAGPR